MITVELILIPIGILLLYFGGHLLVVNSVKLSLQLSIPKYVIGGTIVALGTSMPEFFSVLAATRAQESVLIFSSLIGSNIFNVGVVFSLGILLQKQIKVENVSLHILDRMVLLASVVFPLVFAFFIGKGEIQRIEAILFLGAYVFYVVVLLRKKGNVPPADVEMLEQEYKGASKKQHSASPFLYVKIIVLILIAIVMLSYGGEFVVQAIQTILSRVEQNTQLARLLAVGIIAVGTSLPELVTSLVSLRRKENDVMLGNIVGSCIVNTLFILPIASLVFPIMVDRVLLLDVVYVVILHLWVISLSFYRSSKKWIKLQSVFFLLTIVGYFYILASTLRF